MRMRSGFNGHAVVGTLTLLATKLPTLSAGTWNHLLISDWCRTCVNISALESCSRQPLLATSTGFVQQVVHGRQPPPPPPPANPAQTQQGGGQLRGGHIEDLGSASVQRCSLRLSNGVASKATRANTKRGPEPSCQEACQRCGRTGFGLPAFRQRKERSTRA